MELLEYRFRRDACPDHISDVFDGSVYKEHELLKHKENISITVDTDGSPIFKFAKNTMLPIQFRVNEFPPDLRTERWNCMVAGIWFYQSDPEMVTFLRPLISEAKSLYEIGFKWSNPSTENVVTSKVVTLNCVLDSVAKPKVQSLRHFMGHYGCSYCYHPGINMLGHPHPRFVIESDLLLHRNNFESTYTVKQRDIDTGEITGDFFVRDRTDADIRSDMEEVIASEDVAYSKNGVIGKSAFFALTYFSLVFGFTLDWMHAVLIGVSKLVFTLMLSKSSKGKPHFIGDKLAVLNRRLLAIAPPSNISRRPRSLADIKLWKANEWRVFLLYYSLPCIIGLQTPEYVKHHCLLVSACYILLKDNISKDKLWEAACYLQRYVFDFQKLYSPLLMHYKVHLLLHLSTCVEKYGPAWCFSTFTFEAGNGYLVKLVKGTTHVATQIARKYVMAASIPDTVSLYQVSDSIIDFCESLMSFRRLVNYDKRGSISLLGLMKRFPLSNEEIQCLNSHQFPLSNYSFPFMVKDKVKFSANCFAKKSSRTCDSVVKLSDGSYACISRILDFSRGDQNIVYILYRKVNVARRKFIANHELGARAVHIKICPVQVFGDLGIVSASDIVSKVLLVDNNCHQNSYVIEMLINYEKD